MKDPREVADVAAQEQAQCLKENGWAHVMWRWFWVWRKQVHDAAFTCFTADEAMRIEQGLHSSEDCYPAPTAGVQEVGRG